MCSKTKKSKNGQTNENDDINMFNILQQYMDRYYYQILFYFDKLCISYFDFNQNRGLPVVLVF